MQEIHRALLVVIFIAAFVFGFAKKPITAEAIAPDDFTRRRNLWVAITAALFLSNNFWVFMVVAGGMLLYVARRESNVVALLFAMLLAVPPISAQLGAFGIVNFLFDLNFLRLFSLLVLFPSYLVLRKSEHVDAFGKSAADRFLLAYLLMLFLLQIPAGNFTNMLRYGFYLLVDVFLPYYVASRALRSVPAFRDALASYIVVAGILATIGVFEFGKGWLLYSNVSSALDAPWGLGQYLNRGDSLRALATTGQAIVLGFVMSLALCFYLFVSHSITSRWMRFLGYLGLIGGLVSPLSRGPWIGALAGYVSFLALAPQGLGTLAKRGLIGFMLFLLALASPLGDTIIDHLPFVGSVDSENVTYRQDLLTSSLKVIARNPLLGSLAFIEEPEMEALRWGGEDGIIDVVNSYIAIALANGLISLALFVGFMLSVMLGVFKAMRAAAAVDGSMEMLGRALLATMVCITITIYTVSNISYIDVLFWMTFALGVGYQAMVKRATSTLGIKPSRSANPIWTGKRNTAPRPERSPARPQPAYEEATRQMPLREDLHQYPQYQDEATRRIPLYEEGTREMPLHEEGTRQMPFNDEATRQIPLHEEGTSLMPYNDEATRQVPLHEEPTQLSPLRK